MRDLSFLKKYIDYNPDTGEFSYRPRDPSTFSSYGMYKKWTNQFSNKPAAVFDTNKHGYTRVRVRVDGKKLVAARVAIVISGIEESYDGDYVIDHIDGNPTNNRLSNLRSVSRELNSKNTKLKSSNSTGVAGVRKKPKGRGWIASITKNREWIYLGCFQSFFEAVCARRSAEIGAGYTLRHGRYKEPVS